MSRDPHTLAGAYALYAVDDPGERASFEEHLSRCDECAEESRELRETLGRVGSALATEPPPSLRSRVMADIGQVRQLPPAVTPGAARHSRGTPRRSWWPRVATGIAAVSLAAAAVLGVLVVQTRDLLDQTLLGEQRVAAVLAAPDARAVTGKSEGGANTTVVMSRSQDKMVFFSAGLAPLPDDKTYQLWRIGPDGTLPDGLTRPGSDGSTPPVILGGVGEATKVAVTIEPAGGSGQPTTTPLVVMKLPSA